jgi:hypothetical protein
MSAHLTGFEALEQFAPDRDGNGRIDPQYSIDIGIRHYVLVLRSHGIDTCQSCQGGPGHAYLEPTIEFRGDSGEGLRAVGVAISNRLPVSELRRVWNVHGTELDGPIWTLTFNLRADLWLKREEARTEAFFARTATGRDAC